MKRFAWAIVAVVGLAVAGRAEPLKPAVEVRTVSAVDFAPVIEYIGGVFNQAEATKQVAGILKTLGENEKGYEGINLKRAIGGYAVLSEKVEESTVVLMVPTTDGDAVVAALRKFGLDPKETDGVYALDVPNVPFTVYFTFADDYLYATLRSADGVGKGKLISPKTFFADAPAGVLSATVHLDRIPDDLKKMAYGQLELQLKEQTKGASDAAQKRVNEFLIDAGVGAVKTLLTDGQRLSVAFDIDAKADDLKLAVSVTPKPNTTLAKTLASFADRESVPAAVAAGAKNPLLAVGVNFTLPPDTKKAFATLAEGLVKDAVENAKGDDQKVAKLVTDAVLPTLKGGDLQLGLVVTHGEKSRVGLTLAAKTVDGKGIETAAKELAGLVPKGHVEFTPDAEKVGERTAHKLKFADGASLPFTSDTVWLLTGDDLLAVHTAASSERVKAIGTAKGAKAPMLTAELSWVKLARVTSADPDAVANVVNSVFETDKTDGLDTLKVTGTGGKQLTLTVSMKGKAATFLAGTAAAK